MATHLSKKRTSAELPLQLQVKLASWECRDSQGVKHSLRIYGSCRVSHTPEQRGYFFVKSGRLVAWPSIIGMGLPREAEEPQEDRRCLAPFFALIPTWEHLPEHVLLAKEGICALVLRSRR